MTQCLRESMERARSKLSFQFSTHFASIFHSFCPCSVRQRSHRYLLWISGVPVHTSACLSIIDVQSNMIKNTLTKWWHQISISICWNRNAIANTTRKVFGQHFIFVLLQMQRIFYLIKQIWTFSMTGFK